MTIGTLQEIFSNNKFGVKFLELNSREKEILNNASYFRLWSKSCSYKFKDIYDLVVFCMHSFSDKRNTNKFCIYAIANSLSNQSTPTDACIGSFN